MPYSNISLNSSLEDFYRNYVLPAYGAGGPAARRVVRPRGQYLQDHQGLCLS